MELRLADMAANPYLLPATVIAAGVMGLRGALSNLKSLPPSCECAWINAIGQSPLPPDPHDLNMYMPHRPEVAKVLSSAAKLPPNLYVALQVPAMTATFEHFSSSQLTSLHVASHICMAGT